MYSIRESSHLLPSSIKPGSRLLISQLLNDSNIKGGAALATDITPSAKHNKDNGDVLKMTAEYLALCQEKECSDAIIVGDCSGYLSVLRKCTGRQIFIAPGTVCIPCPDDESLMDRFQHLFIDCSTDKHDPPQNRYALLLIATNVADKAMNPIRQQLTDRMINGASTTTIQISPVKLSEPPHEGRNLEGIFNKVNGTGDDDNESEYSLTSRVSSSVWLLVARLTQLTTSCLYNYTNFRSRWCWCC